MKTLFKLITLALVLSAGISFYKQSALDQNRNMLLVNLGGPGP